MVIRTGNKSSPLPQDSPFALTGIYNAILCRVTHFQWGLLSGKSANNCNAMSQSYLDAVPTVLGSQHGINHTLSPPGSDFYNLWWTFFLHISYILPRLCAITTSSVAVSSTSHFLCNYSGCYILNLFFNDPEHGIDLLHSYSILGWCFHWAVNLYPETSLLFALEPISIYAKFWLITSMFDYLLYAYLHWSASILPPVSPL